MSALPAFREHFNVGTSGGAIALVLAGMSIGNIFASLFQWLSDLIGRRGVTFLGNFILVISCVLQAAAPNRSVLILGRVIGGIGCSLSATVGPLYMSEVAPSSHRGLAVGLYCSCYGVGSILIAVVMLGGSYMHGDWTWRMPMVFQLAPPVIVCCLVYPFTPESPRYLIYKGQIEQAKQVIATYHTESGSVDDPVVGVEIQQMQASIESVDSKPWDFSTLWNKKSSLYRMRIILIYAFIQQCNGTCKSTSNKTVLSLARQAHQANSPVHSHARLLSPRHSVSHGYHKHSAAARHQCRHDCSQLLLDGGRLFHCGPRYKAMPSSVHHGCLRLLPVHDVHHQRSFRQWYRKEPNGHLDNCSDLPIPDLQRSFG
jgi:hypothetical protein